MQDTLLKATIAGNVRIYLLSAIQVVEHARIVHKCAPLPAAALGRTLMGGLLLAATMKNNEAITIKISGDGPLGNIVVDACNGNVRGYVENTTLELPPTPEGKLAVGEAVGPENGNISITRFNSDKEPFTGICNLASGEIADDITRYLYVSEQTPSSVALGVYVAPDGSIQYAGGFLVQPLPEADDATLEILGENISKLPSITNMLRDNKSLKDIVALIAWDLPVNYYDTTELHFRCQCSQERILNMLASLGRAELYNMAQEDETEITCHFCSKQYAFSSQEIKDLADSL